MKTGSLLEAKFIYLFVVVVMGMVAAPAFAAINWTNANANNDFNDLGNWSPVPPSLNGQDCYINELSDANKADISYTLSGNPDDLYVGVVADNTGELLISGGNNTITNRLRVGRLNGTGIVTITDGILNALNTYTTFGDTGTAVLTMSGGTLNIDRVTFGQKADDSSTLNMSAGTININTSDATPATTSGSLRMGLGNANLNISGTAVITAEKLYITEGGLINMSGGTVSITGAEDAQPTFNFTKAAIGDMAGEILFNGGHLLITGDHESLFNAAIGAGNIYTTVAAHAVYAEYFAGEGLTKLVLVPSEKAYHPNPADGQKDVPRDAILKWTAGDYADTHDAYFGSDANAVKNATTVSPEYKGQKVLGEESIDPGKLTLNTTYYWRIDEVNGVNPDSPWAGNVWSFTTGDFLVIDDFEIYDTNDNQIWYSWIDGLGYGVLETDPYHPGNGTGAAVGDETNPSYTEETIVHGDSQSMPIVFDNNKQDYSKYSEVEYTLPDQRDWTEEGVTELSLWFRGYPGTTGSFTEAPVGTYTMTGSGADIWAVDGVEADEFHYAFKTLSGAGSIIARVQSVQNTNEWAKAGVMIRETLDPDSTHAFACVTPANGVASQGRPDTGAASFSNNQGGITAPYWVKLERSLSGLFTVSHSANGSTWEPVTGAMPQNIPMSSNVYIGLAVTSRDAALTCQAVFTNVTTTGSVSPQWASRDIGILSNDAEPLYVAVSNSTGTPAVVIHDDPAAATIDTWTEWVIPLQMFADQGIDLTDVDRISFGLGTKGNTTIPGGSGKMYFDDIRLYRPRETAE